MPGVSAAFWPWGNSMAVNATTTSQTIANTASSVPGLLVTNRSTTSPAWISWGFSSGISAAFPDPAVTSGSQGLEVPPNTQIALRVENSNAPYIAVVLLSGTAIITIAPGDGM